MKILLLILTLFLVSCATRAPKSYTQICADRGMVLSGVSSGEGSSYNVNVGRSNYYSESVNCVVPKDRVEQCLVSEIQKSSAPVDQYNNWVGTRKFTTGVGYFAFVLPGVGMKLWFDSQRDAAVNESRKLEREGVLSCDTKEVLSSN